ncbi:nucleotidyltransferase domain-containing protein [Candidatus Woesearchaeota archaeon]|nr:nucleotidyltransferase domain-containing protein [Candidatus Woesearchaeota archaeon]
MLQKYSRYRILQEFFDFPTKDFFMRELSRRTKISQPSVINHLRALMKEGLIIREEKGLYPTYKANRENEIFKILKISNLILRMKSSGLIDYIYNTVFPDVIILFGSAARGEDIETSDIDLFVQAKEKKLKLAKYEKQLNRKISIFFKEDFGKLNEELKNNILNGIVLKGYIKVF